MSSVFGTRFPYNVLVLCSNKKKQENKNEEHSSMTLREIATGARGIVLLNLGGDVPLAIDVQGRLGELGLLDSPADERFGPVSKWAVGQFLGRIGLSSKTELDIEVARALIETDADDLYPVNKTAAFAGRIAKALFQQRY